MKQSLMGHRFASLAASAIVIAAAGVFLFVHPAGAQVQVFPNTAETQITRHTVRQKAKPDECWAYLSSPAPLPMFTDPSDCARYRTNPPAKPKVNQGYIWGLAESADSFWFGTFANGNCVTGAGTTPANPKNPNGAPTAHKTESWVCEYYDSPYYPGLYPDARIGDARTPRAYQYSKSTRALVDKTPKYAAYIDAVRNPEGIFPLLIQIRGIRAAAVYNNVVVLAGPHLHPAKGIAVFGWNATTGEFLGGYSLPGYNNIRQFLNLNGTLYTAVGTNDSIGVTTGGAVLRVNPSIVPGCTFNPTLPYPCFLMNGGGQMAPSPPTVVGTLATVAGSITGHNGRIFTVTWPTQYVPGSTATLYMSPAVPAGGLTSAHASQWTALWKATDYEPDPFIAQSYAGGAIVSFDGYLWWGTLHIPMMPFQHLAKLYPPTTRAEIREALMGTFRSTVFFRGKDLDTNPQIDLVYGNYQLPVFTPPGNGKPGKWSLEVNKTGKKSLWGPSGFGNIWNSYTWSAVVSNNRMWIGTFDWSLMAQQGTAFIAEEAGGVSWPEELFANANYGADLFYFTSASKPAFPESTNGVDNPTTYGVRNQLNTAGGSMFLGMANAMNLLTQPADAQKFGGLGGWELIELSPPAAANTLDGKEVAVQLRNGVSVVFCNVTRAGTTVSSIVSNRFNAALKTDPLLAPYALNGPPIPPGIESAPSKLALLWSSALWAQECGSSAAAEVSVPLESGISGPRLLQLQWDRTQYVWKDITTSIDPAGKKITGKIYSDFLGILGVAKAAANRRAIIDAEPPSVFIDLTRDGPFATVLAQAGDDVGVAGVQFKLDGMNYGAEVTAAPYTVRLDTRMVADGRHTFTAVARDAVGNYTASNGFSFTVENPPSTFSYLVPTGGAQVFDANGGAAEQLTTGSITIEQTGGTAAPGGVAIIGQRRNGVLISETGMPASPQIHAGRVLAEIGGNINTGIALTNPGRTAAAVTYYFTNSEGVDFGPGSFTLKAGQVFAAFFSEPPFNAGSMRGSWTFRSTVPLAAAGMRSFENERGEGLLTTLPALPLPGTSSGNDSAAVIPLFAAGGGWTTEIVLTNPTDETFHGTIDFASPDGSPAAVLVAGTRKSSFRYVLPKRTTVRLEAGGGQAQTGSVRIVPAVSNAIPAATAILSFTERGITVSQTTVSAAAWSDRYSVYVEKSGLERVSGSVRSGIAIGNTSQNPVTVQLDLTRLDGQRAGYSTVIVPAGGQVSRFPDELFSGFPAEFRGVLRISAATPSAAAPSPLVVTGIRGRYNERGDLLLTSTPAASETAVSTDKPLVFPYVVSGNGYTTQLILFSGPSAGVSGRLFHNNSEGVLLKESVKPVIFEK